MKFLDRIFPAKAEARSTSFDQWLAEYNWFGFGGGQYPVGQVNTTYGHTPAEPIGNSFTGYLAGGYRGNGIIFALESKRLQVFSQARFQWQRLRSGRPGDLFGDQSLAQLERPWVGGTTGDLLSRMLLDADFAGNSFVARVDNELVRLRPDWVEIVLGERRLGDGTVGYQQAGIMYYEGGLYNRSTPTVFLPGEYCHFAPIPDPEASYRGMSWLTPVLREIQADTSATKHKLKFFENAATPNLAVSLPKELTNDQFVEYARKMDQLHRGSDNAYKTLYTAGGTDVKVIGADMHQLDFKATQGAGETRLAAAAGVPPVIAGLSEGLSGSSLNAGNYTAAKRNFLDTTVRFLWQNVAGSLEALFPPPAGARLWYDGRDIPFLHEDQKDLAEIQARRASTVRQLVDAGFEPESVVTAVMSDDMNLLVHSGLYSVQLQPPGTTSNPSPAEEAVP